MIVSPANTTEPIEMPFGIWTLVGQRNHVLDGGAHWRNLANTAALNRLCATAMRPYVKLRCRLVRIGYMYI